MVAIFFTLSLISPCLLMPPVDGPVLAGFAPSGSYGGHWGVDFEVEAGTPVAAAAAGVVSFAGSVAGMLTVTVAHGGGVRTSYSYLSEVLVAKGDRIGRGGVVGRSGIDHDRPAVHWSLRIGDRYLDPLGACRPVRLPWAALRLLGVPTAPSPYPLRRAPRHSRGNLRPSPHRPSHCR